MKVLTIRSLGKEADYIADILTELGASSVVIEPEPGSKHLYQAATEQLEHHWDYAIISAWFLLSQDPDDDVNKTYSAETYWQQAVQDHFQPLDIDGILQIRPSWYQEDSVIQERADHADYLANTGHASHLKPMKHIVQLDPGLASGTGKHPTTRMCLEWLATELGLYSPEYLVDYGTGSGILALAAAKLLSSQRADRQMCVWAVDCDPQAVAVAQENAILNDLDLLSQQILTSEQWQQTKKIDLLTGKTTVLLANILLQPLIGLGAEFKNLLSPDGVLVVTGILSEQENQLKLAYEPLGLIAVSRRESRSDDGEIWILLVFRSKLDIK